MNFLTGAGLVVSRKETRSSAYSIQGSLGEVLTSLGVQSGSVLLLNDVAITDQDLLAEVPAVDGYRIIFRFGKGFGTVSIRGTIYLGPVDCKGKGKSSIVAKLDDAFEKARISNKDTPEMVSIAGGQAYPFYPIKLEKGNANAVFNAITFTITGIIAPTPSGSK